MEMLLIGGTVLTGYIMNNSRKQVSKQTDVSPNNEPNGKIIYDSNRLQEVSQYERELAKRKAYEKNKLLFPHDYMKPMPNIIPTEPFDQVVIGNSKRDPYEKSKFLGGNDDSAEEIFRKNVASTMNRDANYRNYNSTTLQERKPNILLNSVMNSPMFIGETAGPPEKRNSYQEPNGPMTLETFAPLKLSSLSGLPLDMSHARMEPYFGPHIRQTGVDNDNSQVHLERMTGRPSSDNQGTYREKREVLLPRPNNPENIRRSNMDQLDDRFDRAGMAISDSNIYKYITPVQSFRDLPFDKSFTIQPKNIDQLRSIGRERKTYTTVPIQGQKGSGRAALQQLRDPLKAKSYEISIDSNAQRRSGITGAKMEQFMNIDERPATEEYLNDYVGVSSKSKNTSDISRQSDSMFLAINRDRVNRDVGTFTPEFQGASAWNKNSYGNNNGLFQLPDLVKGYKVPNMGQGHDTRKGYRDQDIDAPKATLRDTLTGLSTGAKNLSGFKDNSGYKNEINAFNTDFDITLKALLSDNKYIGQGKKDLGQGILSHGVEEWTTNKETLLTEHDKEQNVRNPYNKDAWKDADFLNDDVDRTIDNEHIGLTTAQYKRPGELGELTQDDFEALAIQDYYGAGKGIIEKDIDREQFNDSVEQYAGRVEFGNHFHSAKYANGDDARREAKMSLTDHDAVDIRDYVNPGRANDGKAQRQKTRVNFKRDPKCNNDKKLNRKQAFSTQRIVPEIRVRDEDEMSMASTNRRLDPGIKIKNPLYPFL